MRVGVGIVVVGVGWDVGTTEGAGGMAVGVLVDNGDCGVVGVASEVVCSAAVGVTDGRGDGSASQPMANNIKAAETIAPNITGIRDCIEMLKCS